MTRDDVILLLLARAGQRQNDAVLRASLETEIVSVQNEYEANAFLPWFLFAQKDDYALALQGDTIATVAGFLREVDEETRSGSLYRYDATLDDPWVPMTKYYNIDDMKARYPGSGQPKAYVLLGSNYIVAPVADGAYTFRSRYFARDTALTSNITNNWLTNAEKLIMSCLGYRMARYHTHNVPLSEAFAADMAQARNELILVDTARREAGGMRQMGDD